MKFQKGKKRENNIVKRLLLKDQQLLRVFQGGSSTDRTVRKTNGEREREKPGLLTIALCFPPHSPKTSMLSCCKNCSL